MKGVMLARKCRSHALNVLDSLPEAKREDYKAIVGAFNQAYVPKEWARTYRGALTWRVQKEGESLLKYAASLLELALTAYPCTDEANADALRE